MLKFIKYHLETITGIEIFPLISFIIFFTFFVALLIWVFRASKEYVQEVAQLPLDDQQSLK
ncbi:MAG: CcoQ/FixQ family Cbb3-type cytochrome c oxidase assembly chaperone [Bacteroidota bacterium]